MLPASNKTYRVLLLENIHPVAKEAMEAEGIFVEEIKTSLNQTELEKKLKSFDLLGIRSKTYLSKNLLSNNQHLLGIGAFCIGTNQIETEYANQIGIPVFNAPYSNTRSVAELVVAEMVALSRQLVDRSQNAHKGIWDKSAAGSKEVRGKTLGIIGYGHIGSQVSILAEAMGLTVVFYDTVRKLPLGNSKQYASLEDVLSVSDFVTLHVPETPQTMNMISEKEFRHMKRGSFFINASRGSIVVISDLKKALLEGHVSGAAIDVFPEEPSGNSDPFKSELQGLNNVILTPHIGGSTEEAQEAIGREVASSFINYIKRGSTLSAVNFPKVDIPISEGAHRILNVHKNVPGVLRDINKIVSDKGANIKAQSLSTDSHIGYLLMDIEKKDAEDVCNGISQLSTSIKTHILY